MYLRPVHAELSILTLREFIRNNPLGVLITSLPSTEFSTLQCSHIPWVLEVSNEEDTSQLGKLHGHIAKANPHAKAMQEEIQKTSSSNGTLNEEVLILFNGPVDSYVTPKFYTKTKPESGKVVPTWNYSAVQVYGRPMIYFDSRSVETGAYLQRQVNSLTKHAEEHIMRYKNAWEVSDAPTSYTDLLKKSITGIEIEITRMEGKFKMSQEMGKEDRVGVEEGFLGLETDRGNMMADTVRQRGEMKDVASTNKATV